MNRFLALIAAVAALAVVFAGCGDSDESTTDSGASLTKAEFIKQGNALCAVGNKKIENGFGKFAKENNLSQNQEPSKVELRGASEDILIPAVSNQIDELRALGTPEGDEGEVDELLTNAEEVLEDVRLYRSQFPPFDVAADLNPTVDAA